MTRREIAHAVVKQAEPLYGIREAEQIARIVLEQLCDVGWSDYVIYPDREAQLLPDVELERVLSDISRGRPIQSIVGHTEFCGLELVVGEGALIPRPESEELVAWVVDDYRDAGSLRIADICSGSGALAVALAVALPQTEVVAVELSEEAIAISTKNIERHAPRVEQIKGDVLRGIDEFIKGEMDVIISNPPYIPISELSSMHTNVVDHEPHMALFVPDDDPLLFYRSISTSALNVLRPGGRIYFEVHEAFAQQTAEMMVALGYEGVEVRLDINDKERMVCGVRG